MNHRRLLTGFLALIVAGLGTYSIRSGVVSYLRVKRNIDMIAAAYSGEAGTVQDLLQHGANPNATSREGNPALWWAVKSQSLPTVQALLAKGASPNGTGLNNSVLEEAISHYQGAAGSPQQQTALSILRTLLSYGADPNRIDSTFKEDPASVLALRRAGATQEQILGEQNGSQPLR